MTTPESGSGKGAGRGGGLLFLAILGFVAYLVLTVLAGIIKLVATLVLIVGIVLLAANVLRRH